MSPGRTVHRAERSTTLGRNRVDGGRRGAGRGWGRRRGRGAGHIRAHWGRRVRGAACRAAGPGCRMLRRSGRFRALSRRARGVGRRVSHPRQIGALADKVCWRALTRGAPWNVHTAHPRIALDGTCGATLVRAHTVHVPSYASLECAFHQGARRTVHRRKYPKRTLHGARCTALTRHAQRWNVQRGPFAGAVLTT